MRLLLLCPSTSRGGAEEYLVTLGRGAVKGGWDVHAGFRADGGLRSLGLDLALAGAACHETRIDETHDRRRETWRRDLQRLLSTSRLLRRVRPHVVGIGLPWPDHAIASVLACAMSRVPAVVVFQLVPEGFSFGRKRLRAFLWAKARRQRWIAVSEGNRRLLSNMTGVPTEEIDMVHNGVPVSAMDAEAGAVPATTVRDEVRRELGLPPGSRIVTTVGRLDGQKGHIDVVPAIPDIVAEYPDVRLVWVGDGGHRSRLVEALSCHGAADVVRLLGRRQDVGRLLMASDLFLFPSRFEGLPFALLEAMAYRVPIVASDASGIAEVIRHHVDGVLFRAGDTRGLSLAVRWALGHGLEMRAMAERARVRVMEFGEEEMVGRTLRVLEAAARP